jgi:hypothetical protein
MSIILPNHLQQLTVPIYIYIYIYIVQNSVFGEHMSEVLYIAPIWSQKYRFPLFFTVHCNACRV